MTNSDHWKNITLNSLASFVRCGSTGDFIKILISLFLSLLFFSCQAERSKLRFSAPSLNPTQGELSPEKDTPFTKLQSKVITPHCLGCHQSFNTPEGLAAVVVAGLPDESKLFTLVEDGRMPPKNPLPTSDLEIIRDYINSLPRTQNKISFADINREILIPSCVGCHSKMTSEENLIKWINKENPLQSRLLITVTTGSMPKGKSPLSAEKQDLIREYLSNF